MNWPTQTGAGALPFAACASDWPDPRGCAEVVEQALYKQLSTERLGDVLETFGCNEGHGYRFGKPMPADEFCPGRVAATAR